MRSCFVICPIGAEGSETRKRSDDLLKFIIEPVCVELDFEVTRADKINDAGSITAAIIRQIETADLIIADLTDHNPNVFYEIGYRKALKLPIIHMFEKSTNLPFDVYDIRGIDYLLDLNAVEKTKTDLTHRISGIPFDSMLEDATNNNAVLISSDEIINLLYRIEDSIDRLSVDVKASQRDVISVLAEKMISSAVPEDPQAALMKILMTQMISNPSSIRSLMDLAKELPNN